MADAYDYFLASFHHVLNNTQITQREIAEKVGMAYQSVNAIVRGRSRAGSDRQESIAAACGYTLMEFLNKGKAIVDEDEVAENKHSHPARAKEEAGANPGQILSGVASLIEDLRVEREKLRFWSDVFEYLPCSVTLLNFDGVVLFQNQESRRLCPAVIGENLCKTCRGRGGDAAICASCPVEKTQESGGKSKFHKEIKGKNYVISTSFMMINSVEYQVILTTQIDRCKWDTEGADHGQEEEREIP